MLVCDQNAHKLAAPGALPDVRVERGFRELLLPPRLESQGHDVPVNTGANAPKVQMICTIKRHSQTDENVQNKVGVRRLAADSPCAASRCYW